MDSEDENSWKVIWNFLNENPGLTARKYARLLGLDKTILNRELHRHPLRYQKSDDGHHTWTVVRTEKSNKPVKAHNELGPESRNFEVGDLRKWQEEALNAWIDNDCRGMVEAVTGAGKTRFALAAVAFHLKRFPKGKAVVIVPSIELQQQWDREIRRRFSGVHIGLMGGGHSGTLRSCTILIAVTNSAGVKELGLSEHEPGLLIADECHTLATTVFQRGLEDQFVARLGISATIERSDGAEEIILEPYFGPVVYSLGYRQALDFGFIAHMRVATIGVDLDPETRSEYDGFTEAIGVAWSTLVNTHGIPAEPYSKFMKAVSDLSTGGTMSEGIAANNWFAKQMANLMYFTC
jgi:RNA polymerase primary sigma factor